MKGRRTKQQSIKYNPEFQKMVRAMVSDAEVAKHFDCRISTVINYRLELGVVHAKYNQPGYRPSERYAHIPRKAKPGLSVICKCPVCEKTHLVKFKSKPSVMPRVYCKSHEGLRYDTAELYSIGRIEA